MADILTGAYAFGAVQTALLGRERFGRGEHVDVSMMEAMMTLIPLKSCTHSGSAGSRAPAHRLLPSCSNPGRVRDGHANLQQEFREPVRAAAASSPAPELQSDPRFIFGERSRHFRELAEEIEKWSLSLTTQECDEALNAAGVPCSAYTQLEDLFGQHPQILERRSFSRISQAQLGEILIQALPVNFQHMNHATANWAATLGQHSDDVLSSMLGLSSTSLLSCPCSVTHQR